MRWSVTWTRKLVSAATSRPRRSSSSSNPYPGCRCRRRRSTSRGSDRPYPSPPPPPSTTASYVGPASAPTAALETLLGVLGVDERGCRRDGHDDGDDRRRRRPRSCRGPGPARPGAARRRRSTARRRPAARSRPRPTASGRTTAARRCAPSTRSRGARPAPTTTCSERSAGGPMPQGDHSGDDPDDQRRPRRATPRSSSTKPPVPVSWPANPPHTSRWRSASRDASETPSAASGGDPKWSASRRRLPGSLVSWSATGGSHSTTPMPMPTRCARSRSCGAWRARSARRQPSTTIPTPRPRYGTCVWAQ